MKYANYGVLNVVAHPHPEGTYRRLFELAAVKDEGVNFRADQYAKTSAISDSRDGIFTGRVAIWTAIDRNAKTIQTRTLIEAALADTNVRIPDDLGFNSKIFSFSFREKDHRMFVELNNEEGKSVSIGVVQKIISSILNSIKPDDIEEVNVFVVSRKNAVEQILSMEVLSKIEIVLDMPNPDDLSPGKQRILNNLREMRAKRLRTELTKARGEDTLILLDYYRELAELAKDDGYVKANGKIDGEKVERSTKDYPEDIEIELLPDESSAAAVRRIALPDGEA